MSEKIHLTSQQKARLPDPDVHNAIRFCPKCGREIPADRQQCAFCENKGTISRPKTSFRSAVLIILLIVFILFFTLLAALYVTR